MFYFVTYNKKTGEITGFFRNLDTELLPEPPTPDEAFVQVAEENHVEALSSMDRMESRLQGKVRGGKIVDFALQPLFQGQIALSADAPDRDGDGRPELPADGDTSTVIRATLLDLKGQSSRTGEVKVRFQVTRGSLSAREVEAKGGVAEVQLKAATETTLSQIIATAPGFKAGALVVEFIPVGEYQEHTRKKR